MINNQNKIFGTFFTLNAKIKQMRFTKVEMPHPVYAFVFCIALHFSITYNNLTKISASKIQSNASECECA